MDALNLGIADRHRGIGLPYMTNQAPACLQRAAARVTSSLVSKIPASEVHGSAFMVLLEKGLSFGCIAQTADPTCWVARIYQHL